MASRRRPTHPSWISPPFFFCNIHFSVRRVTHTFNFPCIRWGHVPGGRKGRKGRVSALPRERTKRGRAPSGFHTLFPHFPPSSLPSAAADSCAPLPTEARRVCSAFCWHQVRPLERDRVATAPPQIVATPVRTCECERSLRPAVGGPIGTPATPCRRLGVVLRVVVGEGMGASGGGVTGGQSAYPAGPAQVVERPAPSWRLSPLPRPPPLSMIVKTLEHGPDDGRGVGRRRLWCMRACGAGQRSRALDENFAPWLHWPCGASRPPATPPLILPHRTTPP